MTAWTSSLPEDERSMLVEEVCRAIEHAGDTGGTESLIRLIDGWRATAEIHSDADLRAVLATAHHGPVVPIERPREQAVRST
jgi:hypothetical protein